MRTERFFVPPEWIALHAKAFSIPAGPLHKQIVQVLRMKAGDPLTLLPNNGTEVEGIITAITKSAITGTITSSEATPSIQPEVVMCAAITKRDTFEWMLQKCTELGVSAFIPLHTERTIKKTPEVHPRWLEIVKEASEQSGRTTMPHIFDPMSLQQALKKTQTSARIVFHEEGSERALPPLQKSMPIALFIGPEGGFSSNEIALATEQRVHIIKVGSLVMRAETAAIVACAKFLI